MDIRIVRAEVSAEPIDAEQLLAQVERPDAGAAVVFVGRVRNHDPQATGSVVSLTYTSHPSAGEKIVEIVTAALDAADPERDARVAVVHRIGELAVGEVAFCVAVSTGHRRLAFEVSEHIVEKVKAELPIWKQQFVEDGSYGWSGL